MVLGSGPHTPTQFSWGYPPQVFSIICWEENMHFWYSTSLITRLVFLMLLKCGRNVGLAQWLIVAKNSGSKYFSPSKLGGPSAKMFIFGTRLSIFVVQSLAYFYTRKGHMKVIFAKRLLRMALMLKLSAYFLLFWSLLSSGISCMKKNGTCPEKKHVSVTWGWWAHMTPIRFVTAFLHLLFPFRSLNLSFFYHCIASLM